MNLDLTEEQRIIQDTARNFARRNWSPWQPSWTNRRPGGFLCQPRKLATWPHGINVKGDYGGSRRRRGLHLAVTEIGKACASTG